MRSQSIVWHPLHPNCCPTFFFLFRGVTSTLESLLSLVLEDGHVSNQYHLCNWQRLELGLSHKPPLGGGHVDHCNCLLGMLPGHFVPLQVRLCGELLFTRDSSSQSCGKGACSMHCSVVQGHFAKSWESRNLGRKLQGACASQISGSPLHFSHVTASQKSGIMILVMHL